MKPKKEVHSDAVVCPLCGYVYIDELEMMTAGEPHGELEHICDECGEVFMITWTDEGDTVLFETEVL